MYDAKRFLKYSSAFRSSTFHHLEARILKLCHSLEKGLTLPEVKPGFGLWKVEKLLEFLDLYIEKKFDTNQTTFKIAIAVLNAYTSYHEKNNYDVSWIKKKIQSYLKEVHSSLGGIVTIHKGDILKEVEGNFAHLSQALHSTRSYSRDEVSIQVLKESVALAQKTPSVCNRQSARVYIIKSKDSIQKVLACHKGNKGFGHLANKILIVTADLQTFTEIKERNQAFIDGGLFGMSLVYALTSKGLATCILNWAVEKKDDLALRKTIKINPAESIIFLIAVGHYPEVFSVTKATRRNTDSIITIL